MVKSLEIKKLKEKLKELMGDAKPTGRPRFRKFDTPAPKMQPRPRDPSTPAQKMQPRPRPMPGGLKPLTPLQKMPPRRKPSKPSKPSNPLQKMPPMNRPKRSVPRPGDPLRPKLMSGPSMKYKLSPTEIKMIDNYRKKKAQKK